MDYHRDVPRLCLLGLAMSGLAAAGPADDPAPWGLAGFLDRATLYHDDENPVLQRLAYTGRLQADAAFFESGDGEFESLSWRRFRSGFKADLFEDFTLHSEASLDLNERATLYEGLTDTYLAWSPSGDFKLKVGKHSAPFTLDGATSSKELIRMERSLLSNNLWFTEEYFSGVSAAGSVQDWDYNVGIFSADGGPEFGNFESGGFGLVSVGKDFADLLDLDKAQIRVDYVHNEPSGQAFATAPLSRVASLNGTFEEGPMGLRAEVATGDGFRNQGDLLGVAIMPYYNFSKELQMVLSYNFVTSPDGDGVRLDRYENRLQRQRVSDAHEFYAGLNRYFLGHKLKWQGGVEYTTASGQAAGSAYDGWGVSTGIRVSW